MSEYTLKGKNEKHWKIISNLNYPQKVLLWDLQRSTLLLSISAELSHILCPVLIFDGTSVLRTYRWY